METIKPSQQWADNSSFQMVDIGSKAVTHRRAVAQGQIFLSPEALNAIEEKSNPKGDVLALAELAGILAAKKTSDLLPLCHPLPLDQVKVYFQMNPKDLSITAYCEVSTHAKTGVEMECLSGVNGALLAIYDLSKAVNPVLTLSNIRLNLKEGGKSGIWTHPDFLPSPEQATRSPQWSLLEGVRSAVITVSDRVSQGKSEDRSGPLIVKFLQDLGSSVGPLLVVPDQKMEIQNTIRKSIHQEFSQLIITTGGTGLGPRDVTSNAIQEISDRIIPGIGELLRKEGAKKTPFAWLSDSVAGLIGQTLVIALPGSSKAVLEGLESIRELLPHALHIVKGGNHD